MDDEIPGTRDSVKSDLEPNIELTVPPSGKSRLRRRMIAISAILICTGLLIYGACSVLSTLKLEVGKAQCSSNLKNIAACCISYANAHQGNYPNDMRELVSTSQIDPGCVVCPASEDEVATGTRREQLAKIALGQNVSYIYVGKGLTSQAGDNVVIAYDRPKNHHGIGINVLFGDYHVGWIEKKDVPGFLKKAESGARPVYWP